MLPVSSEELVALLESVIEQHVDPLQSHLGIIYVLCPLLYLLLLLGLLRTGHCLYRSLLAARLQRCGGERNEILVRLWHESALVLFRLNKRSDCKNRNARRKTLPQAPRSLHLGTGHRMSRRPRSGCGPPIYSDHWRRLCPQDASVRSDTRHLTDHCLQISHSSGLQRLTHYIRRSQDAAAAAAAAPPVPRNVLVKRPGVMRTARRRRMKVKLRLSASIITPTPSSTPTGSNTVSLSPSSTRQHTHGGERVNQPIDRRVLSWFLIVPICPLLRRSHARVWDY